MIVTVSNLYPRPDEPQRGLFNAQQFRALADLLAEGHGGAGAGEDLVNLCLVPEWRLWRWPAIRRWRDPFQDRFETRYVSAFYVPVLGRNATWRSYRRALRAQSDRLAAGRAILATWLYPDGVAAEAVGRALGRPVWLKAHGTDRFHLQAPGRGARTAAACRRAAGVVCVSRQLAEALRAAGVGAERVHVVPNGVDTDLFRWRPQAQTRESLPEARALGGRRLALFVGHLTSVKGPDLLLAAWGSGGATGAGAHLAVIGDGPLHRRLERQARRAGLAGTVSFLGSRPHREVALWMNAADCLCLSSRSEGMPNVLLEALASGLPIAAAEVGACRELLDGEPLARLAPAGDVAALGRALRELSGAAAAAREAMSARHRAARSWRESAARLLAVVRGTAGGGR